MKPTEQQKADFRAKHHKILTALKEEFPIDDAENFQSMVESRTDRHIFAEMETMDKSKALDYFQQDEDATGKLILKMWTAEGFVPVGVFDDLEGLSRVKLVIANAMVTYKRNAV